MANRLKILIFVDAGNGTVVQVAQWLCTVCNYVYDEEKEGRKFEDLPSDWVCPQCGAPKLIFVKI